MTRDPSDGSVREKPETVEVPFQLRGNEQILTQKQVTEQPWLKDFIARLPACFAFDATDSIWIYHPNGNAIDSGLSFSSQKPENIARLER